MSSKQSLTLGVTLEPKNSVVAKANALVKEVQSKMNKINLNISAGEVTKALNEISNKINELNNSMSKMSSKGIDNLNNSVNKASENIKEAKKNAEGMNRALDKTSDNKNLGKLVESTVKLKNGLEVERINKYANALGQVITQTSKLDKEGKTNNLETISQNFTTVTDKANKLKQTLAQLSNNGIIDKGILQLIGGNLSGAKTKSDIDAIGDSLSKLTKNESQIVSLDAKIKSFSSDLIKIKQLNTNSANLPMIESIEKEINNLIGLKDRLAKGEILGANKVKSQSNIINQSLREMKSVVKSTSTETVTGFDRIKQALGSMGIVMSTYTIFNTLFRELKNGVSSVIEIENELISLQRVFPMTKQGAEEFKESVRGMATELATSSQDMIRTITTFKKLGYSIEESKTLAETVTKFNLAGDINNIDEATLDVVSTLKGFNMEAKDVVSVTDQMNSTANKFALTAQDIAEIMKRSSASLYTSGNTLKQSIAMGTVAQEVVQDASKVGNALKTISARIQSVRKGELKYAKDLKKLAKTDMLTAEGDLRSTFDILKDVGKQWQGMNQLDKAKIGEDLFGKHNLTVGYAILNNIKQLDNVMDTLNASAGSVNKEMETYLGSTQANIDKLKESVSQFWQSVVNSDALKIGLKGLNELIKVFGNAPSVVGIATASLIAFKGEAIVAGIASLGGYITTLGSCIKQFGLLKVASMEASIAMSAINPFLAVGVAITGIVVAVNKLTDAYKENHDWKQKITDSVDTLKSNTEASELVKNAKEYKQALQEGNLTTEEATSKKKSLLQVEEELARKFPELINGYDAEGNAIVSNMEKVEQAIENSTKGALQKARANYSQLFDELNKGKVTWGIGDFGIIRELEGAVGIYNKLKDTQGEMSSRQSESFQNAISDLNEINNQVMSIYQAGGDVSDFKMFDFDTGTWVDAINIINDTKDSMNAFGDAVEDAQQDVNDLSDTLKELSKEFDSIKGEIDIIEKIKKDFEEYGQISDDTASTLISKYPDILYLMSQQSFQMQDLIEYEEKLKIAKQNTLDTAVESANIDLAITQKVESIKRTESNKTHTIIRNNSSSTVNTLAGHYNSDVNNHANALNSKGKASAELNNTMRKNGADTANMLSSVYANDVNNFISAQKAKENASNQFFKSLADNAFRNKDLIADPIGRSNAFKELEGFSKEEMSNYNTKYKDKLMAQGYKYQPGVGWIKPNTSTSVPSYGGASTNVTSSSYKPVTSTYVPASSGSKEKTKKEKAEKEKEPRKVADVESLKDRYYALNNELNKLNENLSEVESRLKYSVGSQYRNYLEQQIDLYNKLRDVTQRTIDEELRERWDLRVMLDSNGFNFNEREEITNYAEVMDRKLREANSIGDPDKKEEAIKQYKKLSQATKDYADLVFSKIPQLKGKMEEYANSIKDVYKTMTQHLTDLESKVFETAKYYAEKTVKVKTEAIDKQIEYMDKLRNKEKDEEDIATKQSALADIKSEMDKYLYDTTATGRKKLKDLQKEYDEALKNLNSTIADQQYESIKETMEQEKDNLNKSLEKFLDPENIRGVISNAISTGHINIMESTYELDKAMTNMLSETKTGTQELIDANTEWINGLRTVASLYNNIVTANAKLGNLTNINTGGFKPTNSPSLMNNVKNSNVKTTTITAPINIEVNGNADSDVLEEMREIAEEEVNKLYKKLEG